MGYLINLIAKYTGLATLWLQISYKRHDVTTRSHFLSQAHNAEHAPWTDSTMLSQSEDSRTQFIIYKITINWKFLHCPVKDGQTDGQQPDYTFSSFHNIKHESQ